MEDNLKVELVNFPTKDGLMLHGFLARPKVKSTNAVLHIHGLRGSFYRGVLVKTLAKEYIRNGFNFLSIELRGSYTTLGFRKGKGKNSKWFLGGGAFERFEDCVYDMEGAMKFLSRSGMKNVILEGHSTGCQKIVYYQYKKKDRRVKALVLLAPADDYNIQKKDLGKRFGAAVKLAKKLSRKDKNIEMPYNYIRNFSAGRFLSFSDLKFVEARIFNYESKRLKEFGSIREPVFAVFGSKEEHALKPVNKYMDVLEKNTGSSNFNYSIIKGGDHSFRGKEKTTAHDIIRWLNSFKSGLS